MRANGSHCLCDVLYKWTMPLHSHKKKERHERIIESIFNTLDLKRNCDGVLSQISFEAI